MSTMINTAQQEYYKRPADERFDSIDALQAHADKVRATSRERGYNLKDLRATVDGDAVKLQSPRGMARFTHWSFGQLARMIGAPASYLRTLSAGLTANCINEGIAATSTGTKATMLVQQDGPTTEPKLRSVTSESYGRLWDADLIHGLRATLGADHRQGHEFQLPPTWETKGDDNKRGGAYAGDRDSFVVLVDGGSIVNDPSANGDGRMYRGVMISNSEVGARAAVIERVLFQYICGNLALWGAVIDKRYKRRHVGHHVLRDVLRELGQISYQWTNRPASEDERIVKLLIDREIATSRDAVIDELRSMGATKEVANAAYDRVETSGLFNASPRSFWGLSQGLTRLSQDSPYQDERHDLDKLAAAVMQRGFSRVTV